MKILKNSNILFYTDLNLAKNRNILFQVKSVKGYSTLCSSRNSDFKSCLPGDVKLAPWWVTGIIDSEGNISILVQKTNNGHKISLAIKVTQNSNFISSKHIGACVARTYKFAFNSISKRFISTNKPSEGMHNPVPVAYYSNLETMKKEALLDNKGKSGVYRFLNLTNKKTYIGSSINLYARFQIYYNIKRISSVGGKR